MEKTETTGDIVRTLMQLWNCSTEADLANKIGIERQSLNRYKRRSTTDLQTEIICLLLDELSGLKSGS